jgi:putative two-component system response regulator
VRALVVERTRELRSTTGAIEVAESEILRRLSMAVEWRDDDTGQHIDRVSRFSALLARRAGLDPQLWEPIRLASPLHDAGKVAIPDAVLLKPGKLTDAERAVMETHARRGYDLLRGSHSATLELAAKIAWTHHEKYDGSGYPRGLVGDDIPVEGRIVAVVDVFDALTSDRVYRDAFSVEQALDMMSAGRGTHFDPWLFDAFLASHDEMKHGGPLAPSNAGKDEPSWVLT